MMNQWMALLGMLAVVVSIGVKLALAARARTPRAVPADDADDRTWLRAGRFPGSSSGHRRDHAAPRHVPARRLRRAAPECAAAAHSARVRVPLSDGIDGPAA